MFAYCNNLPVNYKDPYGQGLEIIPLFFFYDGDEESSKENPEDISGKFIGQRLYITLSRSEAFREFLRQHIPAKSDCVNHSYTYDEITFSGYSIIEQDKIGDEVQTAFDNIERLKKQIAEEYQKIGTLV